MKKINVILVAMAIASLASIACGSEDEHNDERSKSAVAQEATDAASLALVDYITCQRESSFECSSEKAALETALQDLANTKGTEFRVAPAECTATCGSGTVTCSGASCYAKDGVGCASDKEVGICV